MSDRVQQGLLLKQAREAKGMSIQTVHEATKIPLDVLKAIEEAYTIRTLSSFYYRGFVKMYAKFLDVDLNVVLDDYKPEKLPESVTKSHSVVVQPSLSSFFTPERIQWAVKIVVGISVLFFLIKGINLLLHRKPHSAKVNTAQNLADNIQAQTKKQKTSPKLKSDVKESKKATTPKPSAKSAVIIETPVIVVPTPQKSLSGQETGKKIVLSVRAKKDTWLQVKEDGAEVYRALLKKGTTETWTANDTIELSGRDIGELDFELNGKMLGPLSRENRRAKKVTITPSGFSVK